MRNAEQLLREWNEAEWHLVQLNRLHAEGRATEAEVWLARFTATTKRSAYTSAALAGAVGLEAR